MNDRLRGIEAFVQAVDSGSFARAADKLHLTRSAVGKSIARLELRLGARLFHRTTHNQSLTESGQVYYDRCVRALAELDAAGATLEARHSEPSGRLKMTAPVLFGRRCVAPVMVRLARSHPNLSVDIEFTDRVVDLIDEGFDLGVRIGPLQDSSNVVARRLGVQHMAICAAPSYLSRWGTHPSVSDLSRHETIAYAREGRAVAWPLVGEDGATSEVSVASRLRFDDLQAIADAAVAGAGLAWLPCWLAQPHVCAGELAIVMSSDRVRETEIHAVWPSTRSLPAKTRAAVDALVEGIAAVNIGYPPPSVPVRPTSVTNS